MMIWIEVVFYERLFVYKLHKRRFEIENFTILDIFLARLKIEEEIAKNLYLANKITNEINRDLIRFVY